MSETYLPGARRRDNDRVKAYEDSDGERQNTLQGVPVIILTTRGRRTGALRKVPLMRVTDGRRYAVIASLGGAAGHPVWYLNLRENPEVSLQDKSARRRYRARTAAGEERAQWWDRAVAVWPDYAAYQRRTDRQIPVVVLDPLDEPE